mgnify:CR=1 FL=1
MTELIKVNYDNDRPTVLARDLYEFLEVKTAYKDWFPRMCEYGFSEGIDFCSFLSESRPQMWGQVFGRVSFEMRPFPPPPDAGTNRNRLTHF